MAVTVKIDPITVDITAIYAQYMSPAAKSKLLAEFAEEQLDRVKGINKAALGRVPDYTTTVDGRPGGDVRLVKPNGVIVYEFELLNEVFGWIGEMLVRESPIGRAADKRPGHPGLYAASHYFLADGRIVPPGEPVPAATEYVFLNSQPYARKIERGLSSQAPDGVYEGVATMARRRFNNVAAISFGFRSATFGAVDQWASTTKMASPGRRGQRRGEWLRRQPAILIHLYE